MREKAMPKSGTLSASNSGSSQGTSPQRISKRSSLSLALNSGKKYSPSPSQRQKSTKNATGVREEFLSPVSRLERARADAAREQQERVNAVCDHLVHSHKQNVTKRKLDDALSDANTSKPAAKKSRLESIKSTITGTKRRRETLDPRMLRRQTQALSVKKSPSDTKNQPTPTKSHNSPAEHVCSRAYRHQYTPSSWKNKDTATPTSSAKKKLRTDEKTPTSANKTPSSSTKKLQYLTYQQRQSPERETKEQADANPLFSRFVDASMKSEKTEPPSSSPPISLGCSSIHHVQEPKLSASVSDAKIASLLLPDGDEIEEDMIDLVNARDVSTLETVEGDDILKMMMTSTTPRVDRRFPSESTPDSHSSASSCSVLHRRRLTPVQMDEKNVRKQLSTIFDLGSDSEGETTRRTQAAMAQMKKTDSNDDVETTEAKVQRHCRVKKSSWLHLVVGLVILCIGLCGLIVSLPFLSSLVQHSLPFCDATDGLNATSDPTTSQSLDYFHAVQPYVSCRPCPSFGVCFNGKLMDCVEPYERQDDLCVERQDVQHELEAIAQTIEQFLVQKASDVVCDVTVWGSLLGDELTQCEAGLKMPVQELMITVPELRKSEFLATFSHEYVLSRALEMVAWRLQYVRFDDDEHDTIVVLGSALAPWACRIKYQLLMQASTIVWMLWAVGTSAFVYRKILLKQTERALVNRMVHEVRSFLIDRVGLKDRSYPAIHLRDHLFDSLQIAPNDRKWLRQAVWPQVALLITEDSRISTHQATIYGHSMLVWEWISPLTSGTKPPALVQEQETKANDR